MPPINEPVRRLRPPISAPADTWLSSGGTPNSTIVPSILSDCKYGVKSWLAETELIIKSNFLAKALKLSASFERTKCLAPSFFASASLFGEVLNTVTSAPMAFAIFTAM